MELPEKIESNLVAYLKSLATWPAYFDKSNLILPGESAADRTDQLIQVICGEADSEEPTNSGNFWHPVEITLHTPPNLQTDAESGSADAAVSTANIDKHKAVAAALSDAICITDLPAQLNTIAQAQTDANLKAFAAIGFLDRKPMRSQDDTANVSGFSLRLYACSNAAAA